MISGNRDEAWPMYLVWPISERFVLGLSGGTWPACCHWPNTGRVDARCPIMSVLTQSYQCGTWFVCSILRELAVSNLGQPLFCLSITWSRCRNAYRDLWIMTIGSHLTREPTASPVVTKWCNWELILATNFGNLCPKVTKVGSQNFGYQIWFCTRLCICRVVSPGIKYHQR